MVYNTQVDIASGALLFSEKPTSVENCTYSFDNSSFSIKNYNTSSIEQTEKFYHVSYLYYSLIGCSVTIIIANIIALTFGKQNIENVDPELLSPFIRKYFVKNNCADSIKLENDIKPETSVLIDSKCKNDLSSQLKKNKDDDDEM